MFNFCYLGLEVKKCCPSLEDNANMWYIKIFNTSITYSVLIFFKENILIQLRWSEINNGLYILQYCFSTC